MQVPKAKLLVLAAVAISSASTANAQTIDLHCEGVFATHQNGFGQTEMNWNERSSRLITIDESANSVRIDTLFGERTVALGEQKFDRYFVFRVPLQITYQGRTVIAESVTINRVTTEISSFYELAPFQGLDTSYMSFSGKCKRAQRQF